MTGSILGRIESATGILCVGIGGGGDVAGAYVLSHTILKLASTARLFLGGISWERRTIDSLAGPRAICELSEARTLGRTAALAGPATTGPGGLRLSEARASAFTEGEPVALIDLGEGAAMAADGIVAAADFLQCDLVILADVGGDALAVGNEANLVSPLADAIMLATVPWIEEAGLGVIAGILGLGCDGELSVIEGQTRLAEISTAESERCSLPISRTDAQLLLRAARSIGSEATSMVIRSVLGERGLAPIRAGRHSAELSAAGTEIHLVSARAALESAAPLARAVGSAKSVEEAHDCLLELGVRTTGLGHPGTRWIAPAGRRRARRTAELGPQSAD